MNDEADLIIETVHPHYSWLVLQPHGQRALGVAMVTPKDPADPGPAFGLEWVVGITGLV